MSDLRTAAQQALDALEEYQYRGAPFLACDGAAAALRAALAQQDAPVEEHKHWCASLTQLLLSDPPKRAPCDCKKKQAEPVKPVAWLIDYEDGEREVRFVAGTRGIQRTPLYTAPPQRKPLTEEEIDRICALLGFAAISPAEIVRAVERAHGIGEQP